MTSARPPTIAAPGPSSLCRPPPKTSPRKPPRAEPSVELAPRDHQGTDAEQGDRDDVCRRADEAVDGVGGRPPNEAAVPAAVEDDRQEQPERD